MTERRGRFFQPNRSNAATASGTASPESLTPHTGDARQLAASAKALDRKMASRRDPSAAAPAPPAKRAELTDEANAIRAEFHQRSQELGRLKAALVEATQRLDDRTVQIAKMQEDVESRLTQHAGYADMLHRKVAEACRQAEQINDASEAKLKRLTEVVSEASESFGQEIEQVCARESGQLNQLISQAHELVQRTEQHVIPQLQTAADQARDQALAEARPRLQALVDEAAQSLQDRAQQQTQRHGDVLNDQLKAADRTRQQLRQQLDHDLTELVQRVSNAVAQRVDQEVGQAVGELFEESQRLSDSTTQQMNGAHRALGQLVEESRTRLQVTLKEAHDAARNQVSEADRAAAKVESAVGDADTRQQELSDVWQTALEQIETRSDAAMREMEDQLKQRFDQAISSLVTGHTEQVSASVQQEAEQLETRLANRLRSIKDEVDDAVRYAVYRVTGQRPDAGVSAPQAVNTPPKPTPESHAADAGSTPPSPAQPAHSPVDDEAQQEYDRKGIQRRAA